MCQIGISVDKLMIFSCTFFICEKLTGVNGGGVITNGVTSNGVGGDSDEEMEVN